MIYTAEHNKGLFYNAADTTRRERETLTPAVIPTFNTAYVLL